jgi:hypothetical protein
MTKKPPYSPEHRGPTLLFIFQDYVLRGATPEEATARLTNEIETGEREVPELKPGWRLEPKRARRPCLVVDEVNHTKTASKTELLITALGSVSTSSMPTARAPGAENFHSCPRARGLMRTPDPYKPPCGEQVDRFRGGNRSVASGAGRAGCELTATAELTEVMRQQGMLEPAIEKWLRENMAKIVDGKPFLSAAAGIYTTRARRDFLAPHRELDRALTAVRAGWGLVKPRTRRSQSGSPNNRRPWLDRGPALKPARCFRRPLRDPGRSEDPLCRPSRFAFIHTAADQHRSDQIRSTIDERRTIVKSPATPLLAKVKAKAQAPG